MAQLNILQYPDPRLRTKATEVDRVDDAVRQLVDNMFDTMYEAPGIGLAATQVDVHQRVLVLDVSEGRDQPMCFINPEILESDGRQSSEEGCLSIPGVYAKVERAEQVKVRALDRVGEPFETSADGLLAVCIQHEIDHLNGKLFIDHLSPLKQARLRKKLQKQRRQNDSA